MTFYQEFLAELRKAKLSSKQIAKLKRELCLKHKLAKIPTTIEIILHVPEKELSNLKSRLLSKPTRTISGVAPLAIMTKPFPCPHGKCIMCPGGPDSIFGNIPQSYTGREPATLRGIRNNFDPYLQIFNRLEQYVILGHNFEKIELIIMGGTFPSFPLEYQEEFIKYSFKALNDFSTQFFDKNEELKFLKFKRFFELPTLNLHNKDRIKRVQNRILQLKRDSTLEKEQNKNELSKIRCVALCIETRPDYGLLKDGNQMLKLGCTRVELGIQSVYDEVLEKICRGHTTKQTKESIRTLKDLGFKVAGHYMPGLPGLDAKKDLAGMKRLFSDLDYRPDMLKLYPCMVSKGTKLYEEYLKGKFNPLNADQAAKIISQFKKIVPEYCRIMRIQRDIPTKFLEAGVEMTNLRQYLQEKYPVKCRCIRCREPKGQKINWPKVKITVIKYDASKGKEFFISAEDTSQDLLLGFIRLRFPSKFLRKEITKDSALIRELHIYGTATGIGEEGNIQHKGLGKKLLQTAEEISFKQGKRKMVVISGIGVREYYRKQGYELEGVYMMKFL